MAKYPLQYTTDDPDGKTCVYRLQGDLFGNTEGYAFQDVVREGFADVKRVVVEFGEVVRIDSCGVGILASIAMSARNAGAGIVLAALPAHVEKVLGLTWFLKEVDHAATVDEALAKLDAMS